MCWSLAPTLILAVIILCMGCGFGRDCQCENPALCRSLGHKKDLNVEVLVFHEGGKEWRYYDWSKITSIVNVASYDPELLCHAHAHNVRLINYKFITHVHFIDKLIVRRWIVETKRLFMDGVHFGIGSAVLADEKRYEKVNGLMQDVVKVFHEEIPGSQISITFPWYPDCFVTQCDAFQEIANHCDVILVTSFDIPTYLNGCVAKSASSYRDVFDGLSSHIRMGIDSRKILMGVSWLGNDFTCNHFREAGFCELGDHSDNKIVCTATSVSSISYKTIMQRLPKSTTGRIWDDDLHSPYFVYLDGKTYHEVWYDDPESISMKTTFMKRLKLRGIVVWAASFLNYSSNAWNMMQTEAMWNALCPP